MAKVGTCVKCGNTKVNGNRYYKSTTCKACYMKVWRKQNPVAVKAIEDRRYSYERNAKWRRANPEAWKGLVKRHYEKNKKKFIERNKRRKLIVKQQTPQWANLKKIQEIYQNCPPGYHVDHIIPLRGENVCGFHLESNLQYLPALENNRKNNRFNGNT